MTIRGAVCKICSGFEGATMNFGHRTEPEHPGPFQGILYSSLWHLFSNCIKICPLEAEELTYCDYTVVFLWDSHQLINNQVKQKVSFMLIAAFCFVLCGFVCCFESGLTLKVFVNTPQYPKLWHDNVHVVFLSTPTNTTKINQLHGRRFLLSIHQRESPKMTCDNPGLLRRKS